MIFPRIYLVILVFLLATLGLIRATTANESTDNRVSALTSANSEQQSALDAYLQKNKLSLVTKNYFKSLFLSRNTTSAEEKMAVAKQLVTNINIDELQSLFQRLANEQPDKRKSNTLLARTYALFAQAFVETMTAGSIKSTNYSLPNKSRSNPFDYRSFHNRKSSMDNSGGLARKAKAAKLYLDALKLEPTAFDTSEKIHIANWLSTSGQAQDAIDILLTLSDIEPNNIAVHLALARAHIITEDYNQSINDLNPIFIVDKWNREAFLLKATALRKLGKLSEAIDVYKALIKRNNDVDARIGLIYSLIAAGKKTEAASVMANTRPQDDAQMEALDEARNVVEQSTATRLEVAETRYEDSDKNTAKELKLGAKASLNNYTLGATLRDKKTDSENIIYSATSYAASLETHFTDTTKGLLRIGQTTLVAENSSAETIGQLKLDLKAGTANVALNFSRETLMATSAIIEKNIQMSLASATATQPLPYRTQLTASFVRKFFSDDNTGDDIQATLLYRFSFHLPQLSAGVSYLYSDYDHPARSAYFDPQNFVAQKLILNGIWELGQAYIYLTLNYGNQTFSRNNFDFGRQNVGYGTTTIGWNLSRHWNAEINAEWSNSASLERPGVYSDTTFYWRIGYTF